MVDPLGGSWFIERLTDEVELRAWEIIRRIDDLGGMVPAIHQGYPQKEIAASAFQHQKELERQERSIVGVNCYEEDEEPPIPTLKIDPRVEREHVARIRALRSRRDAERASTALSRVEAAARGTDNLVEPILAAVEAHVTLGEICDVFRRVFGVYRDPAFF